MSMTEELKDLVRAIEGGGDVVTAQEIVERARDAETWPHLNAHFWQVSESELAHEARLGRAHRLLITLRVTLESSGSTTRYMVHARGTPGYASMDRVTKQPDLMAIKLRQLQEDIGRARGRLAAFRGAIPDDLADDIDAALAAAQQRAEPRNDDVGTEEGAAA